MRQKARDEAEKNDLDFEKFEEESEDSEEASEEESEEESDEANDTTRKSARSKRANRRKSAKDGKSQGEKARPESVDGTGLTDWFKLKSKSGAGAETDALEDVPEEYRGLVRDYFRVLNEGGKK